MFAVEFADLSFAWKNCSSALHSSSYYTKQNFIFNSSPTRYVALPRQHFGKCCVEIIINTHFGFVHYNISIDVFGLLLCSIYMSEFSNRFDSLCQNHQE